MTPILETKLPNVGTTIFTVMSALATEHKAVNLGQGFPDFGCDPALIDAVSDAMREGLNQYPSMLGVLELRQAIAQKIQTLYHKPYDPVSEITVTAGATQAIINAILAVVRAGDEVIVLEPCYDSYIPNIELAGGTGGRGALPPAAPIWKTPSTCASWRSANATERASACTCVSSSWHRPRRPTNAGWRNAA